MRTYLQSVLLVFAIGAAVIERPQGQESAFDVILRGGRIVDGTGNPWFVGDVGIRGDRIAAVGQLTAAKARREIDARGLVVAPGFIDMHTHSDQPLIDDGNAESKVREGVTIDVIGESTTVAPRDGLPEAKGSWSNFTGYWDALKVKGISMNVISEVSYQQIRLVVKGYTRGAATPSELERMKQLARRSMQEGAWGLVTRFESGGPEYPGEVIEIAIVVSSLGGIYTSHIGSEGMQQDKELDFAIRVADEAKMPVHIFHLKIRGKPNWGTVGRYVATIEAARARGLDVTANQYPYTAMQHQWASFFPVWAREGGPEKFAAILRDPAQRRKIKDDKDFQTWVMEHGGWDGIVLGRARRPEIKKYEGMRIAEIARVRGDEDPADTCLALMADEGGAITGMFHTMSEDDVRLVMKQPWVSIASDGSAINLEADGLPHPRSYSTNPRVLGYYVREQKVLTLEDAVRKMTSLPAQILGLRDRGQIREGFAADLVAFDPASVRETNSFERPKSYPVGIPYTIVNGTVVIDGGKHTGARPGRALMGRAFTGKSQSSLNSPR
ncbi:MAG TPA: D-aminoacylase [Vicinamibacterales bacterium]|nr:D-aminoacylase [Vicinamibacterales bacterium]